MGGVGSGNWWRLAKKATTEDLFSIDIRWLKQHDYLKSGTSGFLSWSYGGNELGSVSYSIKHDSIVLDYGYRQDGSKWDLVKQEISFDFTPCNFGGYRKWFLCPHCCKRVAVLYGVDRYFLCRHCYNLTYSCQQETPPFRLLNKAQKIRKRLGASTCTDDPIVDKPKGMHQKTFDRLKHDAYDASDRAWECMVDRFGASTLEQFGMYKHQE